MLRPVVTGIAFALLASASVAEACTPAADLCINEVQTYGTGSPTARRATQYLEFRGPAGSVIPAGTYLVAVDGDRNQNPGTIDVVIDLGGKAIGSGGFLVLLAQGNSFVTQPGATVLTSNASGFSGIPGWSGNAGAIAFEKPSTSFFLISAASAPTAGTDIDTVGSNDGIPDGSIYSSWTIHDSIAIADNTADKTYAALNFRANTGTTGSTVILGGRSWYVGRYGDSFGSAASVWVGSGTLGGSNPNYTLSAASVVPTGVGGKPLNHIGSSNIWANAAPVNTLPTTQTVNEDTAANVAAGVADSDAGTAALTVSLSVDQGAITLAGTAGITFNSGSNGSAAMSISGTQTALTAALNGLSIMPPAQFNGTITLSLVSNDNGNTGTDGAKTDTDTLVLTVVAVNDAPSFAVGANQTVNADAGAQSVAGFATAMSPGPADESTQAIDFIVSNNANALFTVQPAIAADGTLTYTPNPSSTGTATVSVQIHDNGGIANGGVDTSAIQTFTITIDAPLTPATVLTIDDNDADNLVALNGAIQFDVNFSRAIDFASVSTGDFAISGSAGASVDGVTSIDADTVRVAVTATSGGTFQLSLTGTVLDTFTMAVTVPVTDDDTITVDATAPTLVSVARVQGNPTNLAVLDFAVTFSEPVVAVDAGDFALGATGSLAGYSVASVSGSGTSYVVQVNTGSGDGLLGLGLSGAPAIDDVAGNALAASAVSADYTVDRTAPLPVSISKLDADNPTIPYVRFEVVFDEAVTGVDVNDFAPVMGGAITDALVVDVSGSGTTWTVLVYTGLASGTLGLDLLDDDTIVDAATNPLASALAGSQTYLIDASVLAPLFKNGFEN